MRALAESFSDPAAAPAARDHTVRLPDDGDEDLLLALFDEVVYRLDTAGEIPVGLALDAEPGGVLRAVFRMADAAALPVTGAAPKAPTRHGLAVIRGADGWRCAVTVDV